MTPGLEAPLVEELGALGVRGRPEVGGATFEVDRAALYRLHLHARLPARLWVRMGTVKARSLEGLSTAVRGLAWGEYVWARQPLDVRVVATGTRIGRRDVIGHKVELAIRDALRVPRREHGRPPREPVEVLVRIEGEQAELSVDASGELLHRRGWRADVSEAPLRENLAAAVLWLAEWQPGEPLIDPMCGSGTFPIEAATIAAALAPGRARAFAFERWPSHDRALWTTVRGEPADARVPTVIVGSDRDESAIRAAKANAKRAGVDIELRCVPCSDAPVPPGPGLVVVNPPYGARLATSDAWSQLAALVRGPARGYRVAVVCPDAGLLRRAGLTLPKIASFSNGGIGVGVFVGKP
ncbi:MAG: class I SAM-dependent RNA methyltransferase [Myxococcota bacterium]